MKVYYYAGLLLCGVFISVISQVLLKKQRNASIRPHFVNI